MVLILKGVGDYRGIGLVEVIWKAVAVIFNCRFTAAITYHDFLHRLQAGRGTGTATLKIKLLQQVAALGEVLLHAVFLDLHKAYDDCHVLGYTGGLWSRAQGPSPPPKVLGEAEDDGEGGRVIQCIFPRRERGYPRRPTVAHHFQ